MSTTTSIRVGVTVVREPNPSPWAEHAWRPLSAVYPAPVGETWRLMRETADSAIFLAGRFDIVLHRKEAAAYVDNLCEIEPSLWVVLRQNLGSEPPLEVHLVTPSPTEVQAYGEGGDEIIGPVPMPDAIQEFVAAFAAEHYEEERFVKRARRSFSGEEAAKFGKEPIFGARNRRRRTGQGEDGA